MTKGNIEELLSGEKNLHDLSWNEDDIVEIEEDQRAKTIEILNYIKRQANLRK